MRVLVVNAHAKSHECQKAFQDLLSCVKESLKAYNGLLEIKDECVIRTKDNLEDYLYDECTSFSQPNFGKQFDSLDFVIVSGDLHILPWHPSNHKVLTLLRMCIRVKKCLFAIGFAMQALVYLSASNLDGPINVINGDGKGGKLGDIGQLQTQKKIGPHDNFLDSVTGDLYYFQQEANEWAPLCNVGLHHARTAQEFNTLGKFVIKTPIYRPKKSIHNSEGAAIFDESVERKCYIKKIYLNHWLFHNVDGEFIVPYRGRWEVHSFNFTNKAKAFDILAESEQGALIIEYPRIVGLKFLVSKRYKESFQIFSNFFTRYADQVRCTGKSQSLSILSYNSFAQTQARMVKFQTKTPFGTEPSPRNYRSGTASGPQKTKGLKNIGSLSELPTASVVDNHIEHQVFKHSGMATKMKGKLILDHNYIATGKLRHDSSPLKTHDDRSKLFSKDYSARKNPLSSNRVATDDDFSFLESHRDAFSKMERKSILKTPSSKPHNRNVSKDLLSQDSPYMIGRAQTEEDSALSKADVRKWLYPELKEVENPFEKKNWIPGNMSKTRAEIIYDSKPIRVGTSATDYRKKGSVPAISLNPESQRSLRSSEPYVTSYELTREYQKKEDGKILGGRKFVLSKGPPSIGSVSPSSRFGMSETSRQRDWY